MWVSKQAFLKHINKKWASLGFKPSQLFSEQIATGALSQNK